jgi:hypothetical protein
MKRIETGDKVKGQYYGVPFSGQVDYWRYNEANHRKVIYFVNLDSPVDVLGLVRDKLCLTVRMETLSDEGIAIHPAE